MKLVDEILVDGDHIVCGHARAIAAASLSGVVRLRDVNTGQSRLVRLIKRRDQSGGIARLIVRDAGQ